MSTNAELLQLAADAFALMQPTHKVITLSIYSSKIKNGEKPVVAFVETVGKIAQTLNNIRDSNDN